MRRTPIAVAVADLHLSLTQPACRADKDWMEVQAGYLRQLKEIAGGLPILCAGDIFDKWNAPPELIHFALSELPDGMLCVPGQHDLPNHRMDLMHRSGYGVLVKAGKIKHLQGMRMGYPSTSGTPPFSVAGFGWGEEIKAPSKTCELKIAVIHRYVWIPGKSYPDAPEESHLFPLLKQLHGYDVAVCGDNHQGFLADSGPPHVINCGGFIRRKSDEIDYTPSVGVLYSDGSVKRKRLDTSEDRFHEQPKEAGEAPLDMKEFLSQLEGLGEHGLDFRETVKRHLETSDLEDSVKQIIREALEG